jgi:hypothetical protein
MERFVFDRAGNRVACPLCGAPLVKNPLCSGDFYPTELGITLMSYCKNGHCGLMQPDVERPKNFYFGKNKKRDKCKKLASAFHLGFRDTIETGIDIETTNEGQWKKIILPILSERHGISSNRIEKAYNTMA